MWIQDIHTVLTDLELNSQFGDILSFAQHASTEEPDPAMFLDHTGEESAYEAWTAEPTTFPLPSSGPPGIYLINLAVLAAATRLRIDPWNETTGYIQFIALHHLHPSFG